MKWATRRVEKSYLRVSLYTLGLPRYQTINPVFFVRLPPSNPITRKRTIGLVVPRPTFEVWQSTAKWCPPPQRKYYFVVWAESWPNPQLGRGTSNACHKSLVATQLLSPAFHNSTHLLQPTCHNSLFTAHLFATPLLAGAVAAPQLTIKPSLKLDKRSEFAQLAQNTMKFSDS